MWVHRYNAQGCLCGYIDIIHKAAYVSIILMHRAAYVGTCIYIDIMYKAAYVGT